MARTQRKAVLIEQLPPTPCTPEMRIAIEEIAFSQNLTLAEVQRRAFTFFLQSPCSKTTDTVGKLNSKHRN